jgi:O-antigen ligase
MVGPLFMLVSGQKRMKLFSIFLLIMGLILIIIANKRGIYLAIAGMTAAWIYYRYIRTSFYAIIILIICLTILAVGWNYHKLLDKNIPYHNSILHRLELYPFSLHIFQKHPLLGTGLRAFSHESYLTDYQVHNKSLDTFNRAVIKLQTLDNMILTGFVELGSIMTICYLGLILYIIVKYCHITQPFSLNHKKEFVLLLPLLGLAIHSMTYDSLIFPQINWLFHVQLGILAGFSEGEPQGPASPMPVA